jgi:hypothetical protein
MCWGERERQRPSLHSASRIEREQEFSRFARKSRFHSVENRVRARIFARRIFALLPHVEQGVGRPCVVESGHPSPLLDSGWTRVERQAHVHVLEPSRLHCMERGPGRQRKRERVKESVTEGERGRGKHGEIPRDTRIFGIASPGTRNWRMRIARRLFFVLPLFLSFLSYSHRHGTHADTLLNAPLGSPPRVPSQGTGACTSRGASSSCCPYFSHFSRILTETHPRGHPPKRTLGIASPGTESRNWRMRIARRVSDQFQNVDRKPARMPIRVR